MRMIIKKHEGNEFMSSVAVPTTKFEREALYYLKYSLLDEFGCMDLDRISGNYLEKLEYYGMGFYYADRSLSNLATPTNFLVICIALEMKGKYRKLAMLRKKYPQYFDKPGFSVDSRELMFGDV